MAEGKWIAGLSPAMSVREAARIVLAVRFETVPRFLVLAAERPYEDVEYVHQLRVGTRRTGAALRVFRDCLKEKPLRRVKHQLRSIRQAAGEARDWDVFRVGLASYQRTALPEAAPAFDFLLGYSLGERAAAQGRLLHAATESRLNITAIPESLRKPKRDPVPATFAALASAQLTELLGAFHARVEANPITPGELHQLRIVGKRLRYAIELFVACFAPALKDVLYPAVENAQEILGQLQDAAVSTTRLELMRDRVQQVSPEEWPRLEPGINGLLDEVRRVIPRGQEQFQTWREEWLKLAAGYPLESLRLPAERA